MAVSFCRTACIFGQRFSSIGLWKERHLDDCYIDSGGNPSPLGADSLHVTIRACDRDRTVKNVV